MLTAWVDSNDGLLAEQNADGSIKIVFATQAGETDLQGLAKTSDTNHDGVLDGQDSSFSKFGVWQDANSDGVLQAGEFKSLDATGIASIALKSTGDPHSTANGDVAVHGQTTYTTKDGVAHIAEDVGFATSDIFAFDGSLVETKPSVVATIATGLSAAEAKNGFVVTSILTGADLKLGQRIEMLVNCGAVTLSHIITQQDLLSQSCDFIVAKEDLIENETNTFATRIMNATGSLGLTSVALSLDYDTIAPSVVSLSERIAATADNTEIIFNIVMSEELVGKLDADHFAANNASILSVTALDSTHFEVVVAADPALHDGVVSLSILGNGLTDVSGNAVADVDLTSLGSVQVVETGWNPGANDSVDDTFVDVTALLTQSASSAVSTSSPTAGTSSPTSVVLELGGFTYRISSNIELPPETASSIVVDLPATSASSVPSSAWTDVVDQTTVSSGSVSDPVSTTSETTGWTTVVASEDTSTTSSTTSSTTTATETTSTTTTPAQDTTPIEPTHTVAI